MADSIILLYRIVEHNPPTQDDMRSYHELGIPLYSTLQQARKLGAGPPWYGAGFIAELRIPDEAPVTIERTGRQHEHHTLWGSPDVILGYTVRVVPICSEEET